MSTIRRYAFSAMAILLVNSCAKTSKDDTSAKKPPEVPLHEKTPDSPKDDATSDDAAPVLKTDEGVLSRNQKFIAKLDWASNPKAEDYLKVFITFSTANRMAPSSVSDVIFEPQMPSMGHGTATDDQIVTADASLAYVYRVDGIYFIMGGPWEIRLTATVDGSIDTAVIPVDVP